MSGIGVVVALPREMPASFVRFSNRLGVAPHLFTVYCSTSAAGQHVAVQTGVGRTRAAAATRLLIERFSPQGIISFGFAGGLVAELARGTLIIGTEVVCEDWARQWTVACRNLVEQFRVAADAEGLLTHQGILFTSRQLVTDPTAKAQLRAESGACAVDMETAAIVEAADEAGLPWVAVRAIVDSASDALSPVCLATLREDGHVAMGRLLWMIGRSPPVLRHIIRLARDTSVARRHLSRVFERWAQSRVMQCPHEPGVIPR